MTAEEQKLVDVTFNEALACHELLRRLGFLPAWMFVDESRKSVQQTPDPHRVWQVVLQVPVEAIVIEEATRRAVPLIALAADGSPVDTGARVVQFCVETGDLPQTVEMLELRAYWSERVAAWNAPWQTGADQRQLVARATQGVLFDNSRILANASNLLAAMIAHGVYPLRPGFGDRAARNFPAAPKKGRSARSGWRH